MDSSDSLIIHVNSVQGSIGEAESKRLNSEHKQKMDSGDSLVIHVNSFEGSRAEAELNQSNSEHELVFVRKIAEYIKRKLGIFDDSSMSVNLLPMLRVPEHLKQLNPDAYKPHLISVGPWHHSGPEHKQMEAFKRRYARDFIQKFSIDMVKLVGFTYQCKEALGKDYNIEFWYFPDAAEAICIDAAFLVGFLLVEPQSGSLDRKSNNIISDLFLLENQIPFYYLSQLLALMTHGKLSVLDLCDNFLDKIGLFCTGSSKHKPLQGEKHLLDRLRTRMAPTTNGEAPEISKDRCPTITQLHRAGIKFRPSAKFSHNFILEKGILELPPLVIDENTWRCFANLVASELFADDCYASDYIALSDYFIDGPEDVRILVESGILDNRLVDDKTAASLITEMGRSIGARRHFSYWQLEEDLQAYCKKPLVAWRSRYLFEWKRDLKANYFGNHGKHFQLLQLLFSSASLLLRLCVLSSN